MKGYVFMRLADIFTDHMVLQRDREICIFGTGKGEGIIEFLGEKKSFISDSESFCVYLPPMNAGGPYEMRITLNGVLQVLSDIMVGDVYLACGQSNMELTLAQTTEIEYIHNQNIRFFTEPVGADEDGNPLYNKNDWFVCEGKEVDRFSAIGYYFATELQKHSGVPIGVVSCSKGASRVDAWTSPEYVNTEEYQKMVEVKHLDYSVYKFNHNSWLYKNKLLNIVPFANSGVLWYQGESNRCSQEAVHYDKMLRIMIENWRELWNCNIPFYFVQLMPYNESPDVAAWQIIRNKQETASKTIPNTYLVTLVDTGESYEIHPQNKKTVSVALANAVRNVQFGDNVEYCGPIFEKYNLTENGVEIIFSHSEGLHIKGEELLDLYAYNSKNELITIDYEIANEKLRLFWENKPVKIALGYRNAPYHNLYNNSDYLASPFCLELQ